MLELHDASELYVFLKQAEEAIDNAIIKLKKTAFESFCEQFRGEMSGTVLGHQVKLTYPTKWIYSFEIEALADEQKKILKAAQLIEQTDGKAKKEQELGRVSVTLKVGV